MKVLSLFNGISCGRVAFERANIPVEHYASFEIDKYANQVAKANYPNDEYNGDVFQADFTLYKGFDILIGGSPCTHWSIAKRGRETTSDGIGWELFMQYKRALTESGCRWFLYENNHGIHKDIKAAISAELGVEPIMINSALVSAQNRKRCYWTNIPSVTQPEDKGIVVRDLLDNAVNRKYYSTPRAVKNRYGGIQFDVSGKGYRSQQDRAFSIYGKFGTLPCARAITKIKVYDEKTELCFDLTLDEVKALQTLPKSYILPEYKGHYNKAYSAIGNGWTVDVIAHILNFLPSECRGDSE